MKTKIPKAKPRGKPTADSLPEMRLDIWPTHIIATRFSGACVTQRHVSAETLIAAIAGAKIHSGILPPNTLFWQRAADLRLALFIPPHSRQLQLGSGPALTIPLPPLIWLGNGPNHFLFAVTERPTSAEAELYAPPLSNVYNNGLVCSGNNPLPTCSAETIMPAFELFMSAEFTPHLVTNRCLSQRADVRALLVSLADQPVFPLDELLPLSMTLEDIYGT